MIRPPSSVQLKTIKQVFDEYEEKTREEMEQEPLQIDEDAAFKKLIRILIVRKDLQPGLLKIVHQIHAQLQKQAHINIEELYPLLIHLAEITAESETKQRQFVATAFLKSKVTELLQTKILSGNLPDRIKLQTSLILSLLGKVRELSLPILKPIGSCLCDALKRINMSDDNEKKMAASILHGINCLCFNRDEQTKEVVVPTAKKAEFWSGTGFALGTLCEMTSRDDALRTRLFTEFGMLESLGGILQKGGNQGELSDVDEWIDIASKEMTVQQRLDTTLTTRNPDQLLLKRIRTRLFIVENAIRMIGLILYKNPDAIQHIIEAPLLVPRVVEWGLRVFGDLKNHPSLRRAELKEGEASGSDQQDDDEEDDDDVDNKDEQVNKIDEDSDVLQSDSQSSVDVENIEDAQVEYTSGGIRYWCVEVLGSILEVDTLQDKKKIMIDFGGLAFLASYMDITRESDEHSICWVLVLIARFFDLLHHNMQDSSGDEQDKKKYAEEWYKECVTIMQRCNAMDNLEKLKAHKNIMIRSKAASIRT